MPRVWQAGAAEGSGRSVEAWRGDLPGVRRPSGLGRPPHSEVVVLSRPIDRDKYVAGGARREHDGKAYYEVKRPERFPAYVHFASDTLIVQSPLREQRLWEALGADAGRLPDPMPAFAARAAGHVGSVSKWSSGPVVCELSRTNWSEGTVSFFWEKEYVNEEEAVKGRAYYDDLARKPRHPSARMTNRLDGKRLTVQASGPSNVLVHGW
jgi:hypothetical protein